MSLSQKKRILILRLSSLGDVILASSSLQNLPDSIMADWVVSSDFAEILKGHPKIQNLYVFDRKKQGLRDWMRLCKKISVNKYEAGFDLHRSLRSVLFFLLFRILQPSTPIFCVSKQRIRTLGLFLFRRVWPKSLEPSPWVEKYSRILDRWLPLDGEQKPPRAFLPHLLPKGVDDRVGRKKSLGLDPKTKYILVMPASSWRSKEWSVERFVETIASLPDFVPIVLGTLRDIASEEVSRILAQKKLQFLDLRGKLSLSEIGSLMTCTEIFLGNDTGLFHLSEAMGQSAIGIFGPTAPSIGFGPTTSKGIALGVDLNCRPCSKTGKLCTRFWEPYACLNRIEARQVVREIETLFKKSN